MSEWKEIIITGDEIEAGMIKEILESGGIEVLTQSSKSTPYPVSIGKMGQIKLLVRTEELRRAKELLDSFGSGDR